MGDFLAELLAEFIIGPILNFLFGAVWWLLRTGTLLLLYPLMLLTGWVRLWIRERGRVSFLNLWEQHGRSGLHRFGWAEAALDVECAIATGLIALAGSGMAVMLYSLGRLWLT
ncbi:hypothetical protein [Hymenobacter negativus]|uniref:Uncharacterized protein n=1 Tax=Hymenobacter negativus TaxID=2795026 RepID=A0ABS3QJH3_9BACT|nr:hypothetical protein [Hymenobacter negativus]MBO2011138.1 hypothetical protein [Hymenobacter negativus]